MFKMKKLFPFVAALLFAAPSFSQTQIGPVAGVNFAMFRYSESVDHNSFRVGYSAGLKSSTNFGKVLSFQPSVIWNSIGGKTKDGDNSSTQALNYVSVPLNLALRLGDEEGGQFQIYVGPYVSYAIMGKSTIKVGSDKRTDDIDFGTDRDEIKPIDVGANVGLGYKTGGLLINLGYAMGFANISNTEGAGSSKINNSVISLNVAYLFGKDTD